MDKKKVQAPSVTCFGGMNNLFDCFEHSWQFSEVVKNLDFPLCFNVRLSLFVCKYGVIRYLSASASFLSHSWVVKQVRCGRKP